MEAMTDPLIEIAEEMDICLDPLMSGHPLQQERERDTVARWREKLRAFWTPQRKAFMEAAIEWGKNSAEWNARTWPDPEQTSRLRNEASDICVRMDAAYRALVESERGESGNG